MKLVKLFSILLFTLTSLNASAAQSHYIQEDSVMKRVELKLNKFAYDFYKSRVKYKIRVYKDAKCQFVLTDEEIIHQIDSSDEKSLLSEMEHHFKQASYKIYYRNKGTYFSEVQSVQLNYGAAKYWIDISDIERNFREDQFLFFSYLIKNQYGFEDISGGGNIKADTTITYTTSALLLNWRYKMNLKHYFISNIEMAVQEHTEKSLRQNGLSGFYKDSMFQFAIPNLRKQFIKKRTKPETNNVIFIQEDQTLSEDPYCIIISDNRIILTYLNPNFTEQKAIKNKDWIKVYAKFSEVRPYFSTWSGFKQTSFTEIWYRGLYE